MTIDRGQAFMASEKLHSRTLSHSSITQAPCISYAVEKTILSNFAGHSKLQFRENPTGESTHIRLRGPRSTALKLHAARVIQVI